MYVEKPMACSHRECLAMNAAAEAAGLPLFVAYYRRMLPRFVAVRDALLGGSIGTPLTVTAQYASPPDPSLGSGPLPWRYRPEIAGGGLFADMGSHVLDLLDHLLGPIEEVRGFAVNQLGAYRAEDAVAVAMRFRDGVVGTARSPSPLGRRSTWSRSPAASAVALFDLRGRPFEVATSRGTARTEIPHPEHVQQAADPIDRG